MAAGPQQDRLMAAWPSDGGGAVAGPLDGGLEKVETARRLGYCFLSCPSGVAVGRPGKVTMTVASCLQGYLTRPQDAGLPSSRQEG